MVIIRTSFLIAAVTVLFILALAANHTIELIDWLNKFADSSIAQPQTQQKLLPNTAIKGYLMPSKVVQVGSQSNQADYTIRQLKSLARQDKLKGYSNMTKAQLVHALALV